MKKPGKNRFMPENTDTIVKNEERQQNNGRPKLNQFYGGNKIDLYYLLDKVYLKPRTSIDIILRIK